MNCSLQVMKKKLNIIEMHKEKYINNKKSSDKKKIKIDYVS